VTFPILDGAKGPLAEQAVLLGLERPVIDGLRLRHLSPRPPPALALEFQTLTLLGVPWAANLFGARDADLDIVEARATLLADTTKIDHR
jgi:hypothetical protein